MSTPKQAEIRMLQGRPCLYYDGRPLAYGSYWVRNFRADDWREAMAQQAELIRHFPPGAFISSRLAGSPTGGRGLGGLIRPSAGGVGSPWRSG